MSFIPQRKFGSWVSRQIDATDEPIGDCIGFMLVVVSWIIVIVTFPLSLMFCLKVIKEYERAVFFRLGRLSMGGARGPGLIFMLPCVDTFRKVDLRVVSFDVPPQEILSKDSVTVTVDAVIYFRISSPIISVTNVNDAFYSTKLLAQTSLRNILGTKTLSEMLTERDHIAEVTEKVLDEGTDPWGVKVERVEMKDIRLPEQLMRAMAAEAEATREARAKVIAAEGEQKSSHALSHAAGVIAENPVALQLRYLQTLSGIANEHNSTIIFPVPIPMEIYPAPGLVSERKTARVQLPAEEALAAPTPGSTIANVLDVFTHYSQTLPVVPEELEDGDSGNSGRRASH